MATDTTERALERLIGAELAGHPCDPPAEGTVADAPAGYGGVGWAAAFTTNDRVYCVDLVQLAAFLRDTQPAAADALSLSEDGPTRHAFLTRLQGEIAKRATIDVLRNGVRHRALHLDLFYGTPSEHNAEAQERFAQNRFTVTGSFATAGTRRNGRSTSGCSSTGCRCVHVRVEEQPHQADGG